MLVRRPAACSTYRCRDGAAETTGVLEDDSPVLRAIVAARTTRAELALATEG